MMKTVWGEHIDPASVLPQYPRPQMMRADFRNLNGSWDYAFTEKGAIPRGWDGKILVPFSPESVLSGVGRQLQPEETLWYHRQFSLSPEDLSGKRILLHFGAADQFAAVYVNGRKTGTHTGGYLPFTVDITEHCREENELTVGIRDVSDTSYFARGKQKLRRGGMYYTATSGIWQTVWLECVPAVYIREVRAEAQDDMVRFTVDLAGDAADQKTSPEPRPFSLRIFRPGIYAEEEFAPGNAENLLLAEGRTGQTLCVSLPEVRTWSPDEPWLYYYRIVCGKDSVTGYFGIRSVEVRPDEKGRARIYLNGKDCFLRGVLDQGYWPDGLYTAPSDEALLFDIREMKKTGFTMSRKHAKIEAERWYFHCDRLGLLVMQDMVNGGSPYKDWLVTYLATFTSWMGIPLRDDRYDLLSRENARGRQHFEEEMLKTAKVLGAHPSIISWVIFNEGWGQFDSVRLTAKLREADPSRLIDSASGWYDQGSGDFRSTHFYFLTYRFAPERERASILSEVGGYACRIKGHSAFEKVYGYRTDADPEGLQERYGKLLAWMDSLREKGLCGYVYTQWSDIEEEVNGVFTYDRRVRKLKEV